MKVIHIVLFAAVFALGALAGYLIHPSAVSPAEEARAVRPPRAAAVDAGDQASVKALRARIADLERRLADSQESDREEEAVAEQRGPRGENRSWGGWMREGMERLRESDPEQYAEITNRMAQFRQMRLDRAQSKLDFLSSIDTSRMSKEAREVHERLQDLIATREELEARLHAEETTDEEREKAMHERFETDRLIGTLNGVERDNLLGEMAKSLGVGDDVAGEVAETVREIFDATSGDWQGGGGPRGPRGRRGRR